MSGQREPDAAAFIRAVLAPLPKGEEPVASRAFMRDLRAEAEEFWRLGHEQITALEQALASVGDTLLAYERQSTDLAGLAVKALRQQRVELIEMQQRIVGALMLRPAVTRGDYVWKVRHSMLWDGRFSARWAPAIGADMLRLRKGEIADITPLPVELPREVRP